jgi:hypothetical protein
VRRILRQAQDEREWFDRLTMSGVLVRGSNIIHFFGRAKSYGLLAKIMTNVTKIGRLR